MYDFSFRHIVYSIVGILLILIIGVAIITPGILEPYDINSSSIGVVTEFGKWSEVVGSGMHLAIFRPGYQITAVNVSEQPIQFVVPEVALAGTDETTEGVDNESTGNVDQSVEIIARGTVQNPRIITEEMWSSHRHIYLNENNAMIDAITSLVSEAIRSCTIKKKFNEILANRQAMATCYNNTAAPRALELYGIILKVLTLDDVNPPDAVRAAIAERSALKEADKQAQAQNTSTAQAVGFQLAKDATAAAQNQAQQVFIAQSTTVAINSQYEAVVTQAAAQQTAVWSGQQVARAQATATGESLSYVQAQTVLQLQIDKLVAEGKALPQRILAELYQQYPAFANVSVQQALAAALNELDKVFYIPAGANMLSILGGQSNINPLISPVPGQ